MRSIVFIIIMLSCSYNSLLALTFEITPNSDIVGKIQKVVLRPGETLFDIARKYDVGLLELKEANPQLGPKTPKAGTEIIVPSQFILPQGIRTGVVLNLAELRLYFFHPDKPLVSTFPVGIGRAGWKTPVGEAYIATKREHPIWRPPASIKKAALRKGKVLPDVMPAGPNNPLGDYAMNLSWNNYLIHGTNAPSSVGLRSSSGCIRMYPEDIKQLFNLVTLKTRVRVVHMPYKLGKDRNDLYLEAHEPLKEGYYASHTNVSRQKVIESIKDSSFYNINWQKANQQFKITYGYPIKIN